MLYEYIIIPEGPAVLFFIQGQCSKINWHNNTYIRWTKNSKMKHYVISIGYYLEDYKYTYDKDYHIWHITLLFVRAKKEEEKLFLILNHLNEIHN
jgi:hypothetical protein